MAARSTDVRDTAAAKLAAGWGTPAPATVHTPAVFEIDLEAITGRHVYVLREPPADLGAANRGELATGYRIRVIVAEPYPDPVQPPDGWLDVRVEFVESVFNALRDHRADFALSDGTAIVPDQAEVLLLYDEAELKQGLFLSDSAFTFRVEE